MKQKNLEDNYLHKGLRKKLLEELRNKGIKSEAVLDAINKVPRHLFMDTSFLNYAYKDQAFPIGAGQTISQPYTVAFQTELLDIHKGEKILEIGTGSGYQTAVLLEMGARVFTIERQKELFLNSQALLTRLGYHPRFFYGDGYKGLPAFAPFDKILITAAAPEIPVTLIRQLKNNGILVAPVGGETQEMTRVIKHSRDDVEMTKHGYFVFVPMMKGTNGNNGTSDK
ncbi:MAG TPA: protein-L-isoaspartate(D-aspartate) O-methyltransferase [Bacteroidetes bacterium]|nr:protein-L-isoaspartate(D-aspartate) O-methyltransferase [Bacteroidota bacterium]